MLCLAFTMLYDRGVGPITLSIAEVAACTRLRVDVRCTEKRRFEKVRHIGFVSP